MKIRKIVNWILYYSFAYYLPKSNSRISLGSRKIRSFLIRGFVEGTIGSNVNIQRRVTLSHRFSIGNNSGVGYNSVIQGGVTIGENVMIGPECYIYTQNHRHDDIVIPMIQQGYEIEEPVIIKDDVWIGSRVTILPGIVIESGAIIGAGTVVTKDVPPFAVFCGNPGHVVKMRGKQ